MPRSCRRSPMSSGSAAASRRPWTGFSRRLPTTHDGVGALRYCRVVSDFYASLDLDFTSIDRCFPHRADIAWRTTKIGRMDMVPMMSKGITLGGGAFATLVLSTGIAAAADITVTAYGGIWETAIRECYVA